MPFLNVQYQGIRTRIKVTDMSDLSEVQVAIKDRLANTLSQFDAPQLQLYLNRNGEHHINTWASFESLSPDFFTETGSYFFIITSPPHGENSVIGQVLSVSINLNKIFSKYFTPVGTLVSTPTSSSPIPNEISNIDINLDQLMLYKNTKARPCIVLDVQPTGELLFNQPPNITILLITGFDVDDKVRSEKDLKRIIPIYPTPIQPGTPFSIKTSPEWAPHPKRKVPSFVIGIPLKVYPHNLREFNDLIRVENEDLIKLKTYILSLGGIKANADFLDSDDEDDDDDDDIPQVSYINGFVSWDEIFF